MDGSEQQLCLCVTYIFPRLRLHAIPIVFILLFDEPESLGKHIVLVEEYLKVLKTKRYLLVR